MSTPAGWYPDPQGGRSLRWWDGRAWTGQLAPVPAAGRSRPPARWVTRLAAYLFDAAVVWAIVYYPLATWRTLYNNELLALLRTFLLPGMARPDLAELWARGMVQLWLLNGIIHLLVNGLYDIALIAWRGATVGQAVLGLRLVPAGDPFPAGRLPLRQLVRRTLVRRVLTGFVTPLFWLSSLWITGTPRRQDWPDLAAGTQVVSTR